MRYALSVLIVLVVGLMSWHGWEADGSMQPLPKPQIQQVHARSYLPDTPQVASRSVVLSDPTPQPVPVAPSVPKNTVMGHILMYHYVRVANQKTDPLGYRLSVTAGVLDQQLSLIEHLGYTVESMRDIAEGRGTKKAVVLTFDDGYEDFFTAARPILLKHNMRATVYIITSKLGGPYMTLDQLKTLRDEGFEIGAHTVDHRDLSQLSQADQFREISESKRFLESNLGISVDAFCYPSGKYTSDTVRMVRQIGFKTATTTQPGTVVASSDLYQLPRVRISPSVSLSLLASELR